MIYQAIHCHYCGQKLPPGGGEFRQCTNCSTRSFKNPIPTVSVIFTSAGRKVLLVERAGEPKAGTWDLPGGFVEMETLKQAVAREIKEELDIDAGPARFLGSYKETYTYQGRTEPLLNVVFVAKKPLAQVPPAADDVSRCKFFATDAIPWDNIGFKSIKLALKDFINEDQ